MMKNETDEFVRDLDWNLLRVFHDIAEAGGISKASERTQLKQPAISLALQRLERRTGTVLCKRASSGFELTSEGVILAELCAQVVRAVREIPSLASKSSKEVHGTLRIGLISNFTSYSLNGAIERFHAQFPHVELNVATMPFANVISSVLRDEIDIGVAPARAMRPELRYRFLTQETHRPYCGPESHLFGRSCGDPKNLSEERFILTGSDEPEELRGFRLEHGLGKKASVVTKHLEEAKRFTILGAGLCFLPDNFAKADVSEGRLWPVLDREIAPSINIYIVDNIDHPRLARSNKLREEFLSFLA